MSAPPALAPVVVAAAPADTAGMITKTAWRAWARAQRRAQSAPSRKAHAEALARHVAERCAALGVETVGLYAPLGAEVDTRPLANALLVQGTRLAYPRLQSDNVTIDFVSCAGPAALRQRPRSRLLEPAGPALEPHALDLVVTPALAVDAQLRRLGHGGGSYDRYLPALRRDALVIAAVPAACVIAWGPAAPHDRAVDAVCTEAGLFGPA